MSRTLLTVPLGRDKAPVRIEGEPGGRERIGDGARTDHSEQETEHDAHRSTHRRWRLPRPQRRDPFGRAPGGDAVRRRGHRFRGRLPGSAGPPLPDPRPGRGRRHPGPRRHHPRLVPAGARPAPGGL
ncbi:hypothetical protein SGPA1_11693 [Streptomyces misionensis JCM 4497]